MTTEYCAGCNTRYTNTGCDQPEEHIGCPRPCGICREPMTGRETGCPGHSMEEVLAHVEQLRGK